MYNNIDIFLQETRIDRQKPVIARNTTIDECDLLFKQYLNEIKNNTYNHNSTKEVYQLYQTKWNKLNFEIISGYKNKYKFAFESNDPKKLWKLIDWSGNLNKSYPKAHPSIEEMSEYFYTLYEPIVDDGDLQTLESNVYIPETDDPITSNEIRVAANTMKKGATTIH